MKNDRLYVISILENIAWIEQFAQPGEAAFHASRQMQDAIIRNLETIGEAAKHLSPEARQATATIPWRQIAGLRDVLIHDYLGVDLNEVWRVVVDDLPPLKTALTILLPTLKP